MKPSNLEIARKMVNLATSAEHRHIEFNISFKRMRQLLSRKTCFYSNVVFEKSGENARSIDRINSELGYIDSNVVACTVRLNGLKSNLTKKELQQLLKKVYKS